MKASTKLKFPCFPVRQPRPLTKVIQLGEAGAVRAPKGSRMDGVRVVLPQDRLWRRLFQEQQCPRSWSVLNESDWPILSWTTSVTHYHKDYPTKLMLSSEQYL
jgi:hypothetical protein